MFGLFARKDPVCGMKEEKGKGVEKSGKWFCSEQCSKGYEKEAKQTKHSHGCC